MDKQVRNDWIVTIALFLVVSMIFAYVFSPSNPLSLLPWMIVIGFFFSAFTAYVLTPLSLGRSATLLDPTSNQRIYDLLRKVVEKTGLKRKPRLEIVEDDSINAMAYDSLLGPRIAVTSGMLAFYNQGSLTDDELENILAHEIGHVAEQHVFRGALVLSWVSITALVGGILWGAGRSKAARVFWIAAVILLIIGGILKFFSKIVSIITFKFSRHLELRADTFSTIHLGTPSALASGLTKVNVATGELVKRQVESEVRQLPGYADWQFEPVNETWLDKLFSTHPSIEDRVRILTGGKVETTLPAAVPQQSDIESPVAFCFNCGAKLEGGPTFCPRCGSKQT